VPTEACSICGEPKDADELDPHGHFADDDEEDGCENVVHGGDPSYPEYAPASHNWTNPVDGNELRLCDDCFEFLSGPM
jgi:hypothetical protein